MGRAEDLAPGAATVRVAVACSPRMGDAFETGVDVERGATVLDAIRASGVLERFAEIDISSQSVGIWGRVRGLDVVVADGDRIEIYRPLVIDPKEARRVRARGLAAP
jgi:putative ubiquitin-RnfH superfamily antitoxin RatB of RatAB toxin-antitoxin module